MGAVVSIHEAQARTMKAHRLAMAALRHAESLAGVDTVIVPVLAKSASLMPYQWWLDLAETEGIRKPSTATVAAAVAILTAEAER